MIRIFHTVGQGAFYTEQQMIPDKVYTVVYDCGSDTLTKEQMKIMIKSFFPKEREKNTIDLLFISHFHADHINGIKLLLERCKVERVVIPLLDDDAKIVLKLDNDVRFNKYDATQIIDDPDKFFAKYGVGVTKVKVEAEDNAEPIAANKLPGEINSGTKIMVPGSDWFYILYNYKHEERAEKFSKALSELYGMTINDIDINDLGNKDVQEKLRKAYEKANSCLNKTSMLVFSGTDSDIKLTSINQISCNTQIPCGCLYTGDVSLKQRGFIKDLKNRLNNYFNSIGTIQIPHHGSKENWNADIWDTHMQCAVISHGIHNQYGHPSSAVLKDVITKIPFNTFCVTENPNTVCIQYIDRAISKEENQEKKINDSDIQNVLEYFKSSDFENIEVGVCLMASFDYHPMILEETPIERLVESPYYYLISLLKSRLLTENK